MAASVANAAASDTNGAPNASAAPPSVKSDSTSSSTPNFPPPKTDKPRPHVCGTCSRSFARLEHLKRHERSHTKEKPFECPQCNRCFARRDLLLRHQQKLHQSGAPSTRPRTGRRESTSSVAQSGGRVRKNSVSMAGNGVGAPHNGMRPRANTISHIDGSQLQFLQSHASVGGRGAGGSGHSHHASLSQHPDFEFPGLSRASGQHGSAGGLPKLDTQLGMGMGGGLRTAPIGGGFHDFNGDFDHLFSGSNGSTINPAQLHFSGPFGSQASPFQPFPGAPPMEDDEHNMEWLTNMDKQMMMGNNEQAVDGSSPSAVSTTSQSTFNDVMLDGSNNSMQSSGPGWQNSSMAPTMMNHTQFSQDPMYMDLANAFSTVSPKELHDSGMTNDFGTTNDFNITTPPAMPVLSPSMGVPGMPNQYFHPPTSIQQSDSNSISSSSLNGSARHSSVTSISTDSITDATRQALLVGLSHPVGLGYGPRASEPIPQLPSTADLQRFVSAYLTYFHPHVPFLHIPTLSFDNPTYTTHVQASSSAYGHDNIAGGGGCLILAMAAIGALYEYQHDTARVLYEAAKKLIHVFLEERRKLGCSDAINASHHGGASQHKAPLWLVQAMLLNLIYGHNCGDQTIANVSSVQCAALVSLLNDAGLTKPESDDDGITQLAQVSLDGDLEMGEQGISGDSWRQYNSFGEDLRSQWLKWKGQEERKRTYFSVFMLSSILIIAYNQQPRILNSEIRLDLPCSEELWAAETPEAWAAMGGVNAERPLSFADALGYLLSASQRQPPPGQRLQSIPANDGSVGLPHEDLPDSDIQPSTFGCHILINALHVYIWETHQRHGGRKWKAQETEAMHAQIEPALSAWQAAWKKSPQHRLDRAADSISGLLAIDSIPLLDLAYVRLFINLSNTKDACWRRDFGAMVEAVARVANPGSEPSDGSSLAGDGSDSAGVTSHSGHSPTPMSFNSPSAAADLNGISDPMASAIQHSGHSPSSNMNNPMAQAQPKKSERLLRHAAFYAADSISMSARLNATFADNHAARQLPLQTAACVFDCVQVLAEWAINLQERLGPYINVIIGNDNVDLLNQVPGMLLVEEEDVKLLDRLGEIVASLEMKLTFGGALEGGQQVELTGPNACGYAAKLLLLTGYMFEKVGVWPVTHVMYRALHEHATHMGRRAEASIRGLPPPPPPEGIVI